MDLNNCCMPGCKNNITKLSRNHNSAITYHRFPRRNNDLRQKWIKACGRVGWEPDGNEKVCSKHFQSSDFCQYGKPGRLRQDAIPTSCVDDYELCREELSSLREMLQCTQMFVSKQSRETSEKRAWSVQPAVLTPRPAPQPSKQSPAATMDWTNEQVLKFIELYKAEPILWDPTARYYNDRCISADRWESLRSAFSEAAQLPRITVPELKRKRNSLMATYKSMLNKKKRAMNWCPDPRIDFPNWFAYHAMDSFLGQNNECKPDTESRASGRVSKLISPVSRSHRPAERVCDPSRASGRVSKLISPVSRTPRPAERFCEPSRASGRVPKLISPVSRLHRPAERICEPIKVTSAPAPNWEPLITEIRDPLTTEVNDPLKMEVKSESELEQSDPESELEQSDPESELEQSDPAPEPEPDPVCESKETTQPLQVAPHVKEAMEKATRDNAKLIRDQNNKINNLSKLCRHLRTRVKSYKQLVRRRDKTINGLHEEMTWLNTQISGKETQAGSNNVQNKPDAPRIELTEICDVTDKVTSQTDVSTNKPRRRVPLIHHRPKVSPLPRHIEASPAGFQRTSDIRQNSLVIQIDGQHNTVMQPKLVRINDAEVVNRLR